MCLNTISINFRVSGDERAHLIMIDWWEGLSGKKCSWEMIELCVRRIISKCFKTNNLLIYSQGFYLKDLLHTGLQVPNHHNKIMVQHHCRQPLPIYFKDVPINVQLLSINWVLKAHQTYLLN